MVLNNFIWYEKWNMLGLCCCLGFYILKKGKNKKLNSRFIIAVNFDAFRIFHITGKLKEHIHTQLFLQNPNL